MRRRSIATTVLALLVLSGCDGDPGAPTAEPSPGPTASVTPTPSAPEPTPTPTATATPVDPHPALADLIISTAGVGPLTVGVPPATNPGAAMIAWDPDFCGAEYEGPEPGRWAPAGYDADTNYLGQPATPMFIAADDTAVYRIDVMGTGPHTEEGVRIGTSLVDLQAAYPDLSGPFAGPGSQVWWVQDAAGTMVFETQGGDMVAPGAPEQVILIRVLAPRQDPAFATANSGNVGDPCF